MDFCQLFNTLSRFVIAFLPKNKHLLISRLQLPPTVILESKETKAEINKCNLIKLKVRLVKALVFPVVMYGCESWTVKKAER